MPESMAHQPLVLNVMHQNPKVPHPTSPHWNNTDYGIACVYGILRFRTQDTHGLSNFTLVEM
jgi:hypothetical protein